MKQYIAMGLVVLSGLFVFDAVHAQDLPKPKGKVILTVSGSIKNTNTDANTAEFDREMLLNLEVRELNTGTPWSEGVDSYRGPLLRSLMAAVGAQAGNLSVTALNDYSAVVPSQDGEDYNVILAMDLNGTPMSVRNKGPLFLLYPFNELPSLNNEVIHNRSVWQIKSIRVE
ncbi:molybdopterin-binding oxidoreductase [Marinomonas pontica]|uniref:Molybdopterin-binding oxidoreductase n=1 Tax=Marinomonas pontica TaxID=264739 RepID=A0ABN6WMF7_9GAMM|nr:hypothetical protein [Marinomonas pontica]MCW8356649.1 hypothetical protein [Marinomonas pontica]BDX02615.1 molybdopterin-binding oxidoreductase [Marinomonas pontica]